MTSVVGRIRVALAASLLCTSALLTAVPAGGVGASIDDDDWLAIVNSYRAMSGLGPVGENPTWSEEGRAHSCYMLLNGISHTEDPSKPGYSVGGHTAGTNGNVAVSSAVTATPRSHIDLWMTGPFHAIGVLRHNLTASGFGLCANPDTSPWRSGATLDVIRGLNPSQPRPDSPIVFPGREATVPLYRFIAESPNPVTLCGWSGSAGLPLIAMMPDGVTNASAALTGPDGSSMEVCALHPGNTGSDSTARGVLESENAVVVVPREELDPGRYTATVTSDGGQATWSFGVDPDAPLPTADAPAPSGPAEPTSDSAGSNGDGSAPSPMTAPVGTDTVFEPVTPYRHADSRRGHRIVRLPAGIVVPLEIGGPGVGAVSANFTVVAPAAPGHLTVFDCDLSTPDVSTVNFTDRPVANQAVVPLSTGSMCMRSSADADVIVDVNGWFRPPSAAASSFEPRRPSRVYDTRGADVARLSPGEVRSVTIPGVPDDTAAVALNLTAVEPSADGWLQAFPCGEATDFDVSNVNFAAGRTRPNSAVVPLSAGGTVCLRSDVHTDVIVDLGGVFTPSGDLVFTALRPTRLLDTRSTSPSLNPATAATRVAPDAAVSLKLAGSYGIPDDARAVALNVTAVTPAAPGYLTVYPCGDPPASSNLNFDPTDLAVANGAVVGLDGDGAVCLVANQATHVLLDISGVWR
ncbi:MAG: CAP domain-containing protein [Ilumatobacteraceae bacterium]